MPPGEWIKHIICICTGFTCRLSLTIHSRFRYFIPECNTCTTNYSCRTITVSIFLIQTELLYWISEHETKQKCWWTITLTVHTYNQPSKRVQNAWLSTFMSKLEALSVFVNEVGLRTTVDLVSRSCHDVMDNDLNFSNISLKDRRLPWIRFF